MYEIRVVIRTMRLYQWSKNALIFVPLIAAHKVFELEKLSSTFLTFIGFGLLASSLYIYNDIVDRESDALHPLKRKRPIASNAIQKRHAIILASVMAIIGYSLLFFISSNLLLVSFIYTFIVALYTLKLKEVPILDVLVLGIFYMIRLVLGAVAAEIVLSKWLILFSLFYFTSIGLLKRFSEISNVDSLSILQHNRRNYQHKDSIFLLIYGMGSLIGSSSVLAIYFTSPEVLQLYSQPELLLWTLPTFLSWNVSLWFKAYRGDLIEDPVSYLIRDKQFYLTSLLLFSLGVMAL